MKNLVGTVFLSRFRVDTLLSAGASGSLYRGWDLKRNLPLSIKVFETPVPYDPNALCFQQDDGTLQTLMHPNIAPFYGLFEDQGLSFLVEKYIEGQVLAQILQQRNGQPCPDARSPDLSENPGHHAGIRPRIWPGALYGQPVQHFNRAGWHDHADQFWLLAPCRPLDVFLRHPGAAGLQRPRTAAQRQRLARYRCLCPRHALLRADHRRASFLAHPHQQCNCRPRHHRPAAGGHLNQPPPDPCQLNSSLPDGIGETISIALAKDPKQRYQSVQEMLEIICATFGVPVQQVPDRLKPAAGSPQTATQVMQSGT